MKLHLVQRRELLDEVVGAGRGRADQQHARRAVGPAGVLAKVLPPLRARRRLEPFIQDACPRKRHHKAACASRRKALRKGAERWDGLHAFSAVVQAARPASAAKLPARDQDRTLGRQPGVLAQI